MSMYVTLRGWRQEVHTDYILALARGPLSHDE